MLQNFLSLTFRPNKLDSSFKESFLHSFLIFTSKDGANLSGAPYVGSLYGKAPDLSCKLTRRKLTSFSVVIDGKSFVTPTPEPIV
jgi:hypothetical protein